MRLQLSAPPARAALAAGLACALCGVACGRVRAPAGRRGEVTAHLGYYADDDHTTVVAPSVRARVPVSDRVTVSAGYATDIITSASVDIVASASRMFEQRHESSAGVSAAVDEQHTVGVTARDSRENDYISDGVGFTLDRESPRHDETVHLEVRGRYDRVGPGLVLREAGQLWAVTATGSLTRVLDRRTMLRVAAQADVLDGLQSSVYRYVYIGPAAYPERVPELRVRGGATVRLQHSVLPALAVYAEYALSGDSWGVVAHTGEVGARWELAPFAMLVASNRFAVQTAATFHRAQYDTLTQYRTRDRLLGGIWTFWPQLSLRFNVPAWPAAADWEIGLAAALLWQHFEDFAPLSRRDALLLETWLARRF